MFATDRCNPRSGYFNADFTSSQRLYIPCFEEAVAPIKQMLRYLRFGAAGEVNHCSDKLLTSPAAPCLR